MSKEKKHPGGRPRIYTTERLFELAESLYAWVEENNCKKKFALLGDWCFDNGFNPKYFGVYSPQLPEFEEAYLWAKSWQEHMVTKGALNQSLNARFAQFFLGCCHDWRTKDSSEDKLTTLKNEFGKYLEEAKSEDEDSNE